MPVDPLILCLETSAKVCSVALGQNGKLLALNESPDEKYSHSENLTLYVKDVCKQTNLLLQDVAAIAVSKGMYRNEFKVGVGSNSNGVLTLFLLQPIYKFAHQIGDFTRWGKLNICPCNKHITLPISTRCLIHDPR